MKESLKKIIMDLEKGPFEISVTDLKRSTCRILLENHEYYEIISGASSICAQLMNDYELNRLKILGVYKKILILIRTGNGFEELDKELLCLKKQISIMPNKFDKFKGIMS